MKAKQIVLPSVDGEAEIVITRLGKKNAGRELDGRTWDELPSGGRDNHPRFAAKHEEDSAAMSTDNSPSLLERSIKTLEEIVGAGLSNTELNLQLSRSVRDLEVEKHLATASVSPRAAPVVEPSDEPGLADVEARPPSSKTREVAIDDIIIPPHRKVDPTVVRALVHSIEHLGLLHPIVLTPDYRLVAGRNRIAAFIELGRPTIEARIDSWSKIQEELIEIDENLIRRRLTVLERGEHLARRKELYEAIHPETRQHVRGGNRKAAGPATAEMISVAPAFAADVATKLGVTDRTVREEIRIGKDLATDAAQILRDTRFADEKAQLTQLTRLHREQRAWRVSSACRRRCAFCRRRRRCRLNCALRRRLRAAWRRGWTRR